MMVGMGNIAIQVCVSHEECLQGGLCIKNPTGNGECYCPMATSGNNCE